MRQYLVECVLLHPGYIIIIGLGLGLDLVSSWLVAMHTYNLYYFPLSLLGLPSPGKRRQLTN